MKSIPFTRTELELLVKAIEVANRTGWPTGDDRVRVNALKQQIEGAIAELRKDGWQGFNKP